MGLYNVLFGVNPLTGVLLKMLDIDQPEGKWRSGRFRDIFLNDGGTRIYLYTRNGGGNRECWGESDVDAEGNCTCPGCTIEEHLPKHLNYICDADDDFDCTYATVTFSVPEAYLSITQALATGEEPASVSERFLALVASWEEGAGKEVDNGGHLSLTKGDA